MSQRSPSNRSGAANTPATPAIRLLPQKVSNSEQLAPLQYKLHDTARLLQVSVNTVERLIRRGELGSVGRGKLRRVPLSDILAWQERNRNEVD